MPSHDEPTTATAAGSAVAVALRLALGTPRLADRHADWRHVFDVASRELLVPLAWWRSGPLIRSHAPPAIGHAWRRTALAAHLRGQQQLELLRIATGALDDAAVDAVVLKGMPLGERLYGDPFVRCSADIDLYVPARQRTRATVALETVGWRRGSGGPPWHETWSLWHDETEFHLEVHSSLVSDHLAHLPVGAPETATMAVGGEVVRALGGAFVAPYLAAHLATHQLPPLLWLVDFATLLGRLSDSERLEAERAAQLAGLGRYLTWARGRAVLIDRASEDDAAALGALGIDRDGRRDVHSIRRHLALAASIRDKVRVAAAFIVPHPVRGDLRALVRYTVARVRTRLRSLWGASRPYGSPDPGGRAGTALSGPVERALRVDRSDMLALTGDVIRAGGAVWVRAPGGSMLPTIARGALVRVDSLPGGGVSKGDVVLALTDDGEPFLHRVVAVADGWITTRGDAAIHTDPPVALTRVIGLATAVRTADGDRMLGRRARRSVAVTMLTLRRRVARVVRRAR